MERGGEVERYWDGGRECEWRVYMDWDLTNRTYH
jgi:hypothetical protein